MKAKFLGLLEIIQRHREYKEWYMSGIHWLCFCGHTLTKCDYNEEESRCKGSSVTSFTWNHQLDSPKEIFYTPVYQEGWTAPLTSGAQYPQSNAWPWLVSPQIELEMVATPLSWIHIQSDERRAILLLLDCTTHSCLKQHEISTTPKPYSN
jgi:hypothetical protein